MLRPLGLTRLFALGGFLGVLPLGDRAHSWALAPLSPPAAQEAIAFATDFRAQPPARRSARRPIRLAGYLGAAQSSAHGLVAPAVSPLTAPVAGSICHTLLLAVPAAYSHWPSVRRRRLSTDSPFRIRCRTLRLAVSMATMPVLPSANSVRPSAETAAPPIRAPLASASVTRPARRLWPGLSASCPVRSTLGREAGVISAIRPLEPLTAYKIDRSWLKASDQWNCSSMSEALLAGRSTHQAKA